MRIADILKHKGGAVVTIAPDASVRDLLALLAEHRIGAVVVSPDGGAVAGIVSERDVVRRLQAVGVEVLDGPVEAIMTAEVHTCVADCPVEDLMVTMTEHRIRHVPVLEDDRLVGIVSIGDVVKRRLADLASERDQLTAYISS